MAVACTHLDTVEHTEKPTGVGCEECLRIGTRWLHLRMCQQCGEVGCCDDSPMRHASAHFAKTTHPIIRSIEPSEDWSWCFVDEVGFILSDAP